jgi:hypothetical protein
MADAARLICSTAFLHCVECPTRVLSPPGHYSFLIYHTQANNQRDLLFTSAFIARCSLASLYFYVTVCMYVKAFPCNLEILRTLLSHLSLFSSTIPSLLQEV